MSASVRVIQPSGILNGVQAKQIRLEVANSLASGIQTVLIDLEQITFIDSSGLGELVSAFKLMRTGGGKLCFCSVSEQPRMLFELTGVDQLFELFSNQEEFNHNLAVGMGQGEVSQG